MLIRIFDDCHSENIEHVALLERVYIVECRLTVLNSRLMSNSSSGELNRVDLRVSMHSLL